MPSVRKGLIDWFGLVWFGLVSRIFCGYEKWEQMLSQVAFSGLAVLKSEGRHISIPSAPASMKNIHQRFDINEE